MGNCEKTPPAGAGRRAGEGAETGRRVLTKSIAMEALEKCAAGLSASETVEEYAVENGQAVLVKRKVTRREIPPDIKAVKMLLEADGAAEPTDGQLEAERTRLMNLLKEDCFDG